MESLTPLLGPGCGIESGLLGKSDEVGRVFLFIPEGPGTGLGVPDDPQLKSKREIRSLHIYSLISIDAQR